MIDIRRAETIAAQDAGWLKSRHQFSFGSYYDESNRFFGPLCVFNHDIVEGGRGFGAHPHREMEIVSVVLRGELQHEDSTGHKAVTTFGGIQRMSAGTGIIHSEINPGEEPVELLQIWFVPEQAKLAPSYETSHYDPQAMHGRWLPVVTREGGPQAASIHQDLSIQLIKLAPGTEAGFQPDAPNRLQYLYIIEGAAAIVTSRGDSVEEEQLRHGDTVRIAKEDSFQLAAQEHVFALLIDMASSSLVQQGREGGGQS